MKRLLFLLTLAAFLMPGTVLAQGHPGLGKAQWNAGVGFSGWGIPVYAGFDYGIRPDLSLGGEVSFRSYRESYKTYKYKHSIAGFGGNGNYHFNRLLNIPLEWDFYAGLNLGFFIWSSPGDYPGDHNSGLGLGAQVGGRYFFSDKVGLNLEFGSGNAFSGGKFGFTVNI